MGKSMKVAKWEIKRNVTNKSFIISLLMTPLIFLVFFLVPSFFNSDSEPNNNSVKVYVLDELNLWSHIQELVSSHELNWDIEKTDNEASVRSELSKTKKTVFIPLTEQSLEQGKVPVYMSADMDKDFLLEANLLEVPLRQLQMEQIGLTEEQKLVMDQGISLEPVIEKSGSEKRDKDSTAGDPLERAVPGIFAGVILFSIVMTGMMIFTSASQEKKEKVAEIILSSVSPGDLMQGKIVGYFILGIIQVTVWIAVAIPLFIWKFDIPLLTYLLVPELLLLLLISLAGYLLFAAIFVGIGATVEDLTATSNFQGMVMMLPFLPLLFISPVFNDPNGLIAKITSFIPFTAPGVLLMRLSILDEWPWIELILALVVLAISIWVMMKLAGKVFKVGILMYGKNATPKEIWKWLWT
ncbi:ABC transporter permease [Siminovitchia sediminis]|uniref:ABC transporter permease n=1 Tax=Siminovitchia sediminis TaxID=1274353 RepID=A0ABW4KMY7_9BACI